MYGISAALLCFCAAFSCAATITPTDAGWSLANTHYRIALDTGSGLALTSVQNLALPDGNQEMLLESGLRAVFELRVPDGDARTKYLSSDLRVDTARVESSEGSSTLVLGLRPVEEGPLDRAELRIEVDPGPESLWKLEFTCRNAGEAAVALPILDGLSAGDVRDVTYVWPYWAGVLNDVPIEALTYYGQYARMQVMGFCGTVEGATGGLSVVCRDTSLLRKSFELSKRVPKHDGLAVAHRYGLPYWEGARCQEGMALCCYVPEIPVRPGETVRLPPMAVGVFAGDWRQVLDNYRAWAGDWWQPHRRRAVRDTFYYGLPDLYAKQSLPEALEEVPRLRRYDCCQFMVQARHVNGVYDYRPDFGLEGLRQYVAALRGAGLSTCHYVEGYIAHETSPVYREHGVQWRQMHGEQGVKAFANEAMCLAWEPWHGFLAETSARLARDLGLDVIYLDELGFGTLDKARCDNPLHGHAGRLIGLNGVRELVRRVRSELDKTTPQVGLSTEGPAVDLLLNEFDSVLDYGCRQRPQNPGLYRAPVHLLRFVFPDFKFIDLPTGTPDEQIAQLREVLFNGNGAENYLDGTPHAAEAEALMQVLRQSRDAFKSLQATPLVPTTHDGVYANLFPTPTKTLLTVYNTNDYRVAGALVAVKQSTDTHWVDMLAHRAVRVDRGSAVLDLLPQHVAVIAGLPRMVKLEQHGLSYRVSAPEGTRLQLVQMNDGDLPTETQMLEPLVAELDLASATRQGAHRVALRLWSADAVIDVVELPRVQDVDIARFCEISAAGPGETETAADPGAMVDGNPGTVWPHPWNAEWPAWVQLDWQSPQSINLVQIRASEAVYMPLEYQIETSADGETWQVVAREEREKGRAEMVQTSTFATTTARHLRVVFTKGSHWAGRADIAGIQVRLVPAEP